MAGRWPPFTSKAGRARYVDLEGEVAEHDRALITLQEAARRLGVTTETIRSWITKGRLERYQIEAIGGSM